ncbi:hypothetical protein [Hydrococcus rivularis]|nr:hypothetical protein [Hydrococcus rivularis]
MTLVMTGLVKWQAIARSNQAVARGKIDLLRNLTRTNILPKKAKGNLE